MKSVSLMDYTVFKGCCNPKEQYKIAKTHILKDFDAVVDAILDRLM